MAHTITLIPGDGIGPEVAQATQRVLEAAGVKIEWDIQNAGAAVAEARGTTLPTEVLDSIKRNKVALKGPIGTPIGKGFKSVNVSLRQALDLYANVRPIRSLPGLEPRFEGTDIVIVRENTEDLYAGLELMIMPGIAQSIKLITEVACTRICEYAFDYAERMGRKRVTVVHKANIMKLSDGLLLESFRKVALKHPKIEPTDRSMCPMTITITMPMASTSTYALPASSACAFDGVSILWSESTSKTIASSTSASTMVYCWRFPPNTCFRYFMKGSLSRRQESDAGSAGAVEVVVMRRIRVS